MDVTPTCADVVILTDEERRVLTRRANAARCPHRDVLRSRIVLAAADGVANAQIARDIGVCEDTARRWRKRFCSQRLDGLKDRPRSGRPRVFTPVEVAEVKALACTRPADHGLPLRRWSTTELRTHAVATGLVRTVSPSADRSGHERHLVDSECNVGYVRPILSVLNNSSYPFVLTPEEHRGRTARDSKTPPGALGSLSPHGARGG